jgi:hypothetical protein
MSIQGWYYLHTNGSLIYKRDFDGTVADFRDSDFVRAFWPLDPSDREGPWPSIHVFGLTKSGAPIHLMARGKHRVPDDRMPVVWRVNGDE